VHPHARKHRAGASKTRRPGDEVGLVASPASRSNPGATTRPATPRLDGSDGGGAEPPRYPSASCPRQRSRTRPCAISRYPLPTEQDLEDEAKARRD
jgi:hypothetical protein